MTASRARMYAIELMEYIEEQERQALVKDRATEALTKELGEKLQELRVQGNLVIRLQHELAEAKRAG